MKNKIESLIKELKERVKERSIIESLIKELKERVKERSIIETEYDDGYESGRKMAYESVIEELEVILEKEGK